MRRSYRILPAQRQRRAASTSVPSQGQGGDVGDPATIGQTPHDVSTTLSDGVAGMRLAFVETVFFDDADPDVVAAVPVAGDELAGLGADMTSIEAPEIDEVMGSDSAPHRARTVQAEGYAGNRRFLEESLDKLDPVVAQRMGAGRDLSANDFLEAFDAWRQVQASFAERTSSIDSMLKMSTSLSRMPRRSTPPGSMWVRSVYAS